MTDPTETTPLTTIEFSDDPETTTIESGSFNSLFQFYRKYGKCHMRRHKSTSKSISFLGVFYPTSPFILPF